ncbi:MAG: glutamine amidotransferase [Spiribacter salinus]|uniref:Glutamine amidotransferase n=1 Tax=Spiribacter salinus TaxID=1335746 RepID=A0A540VUU9_9GAMM|nr:MAG: glutamine amidotransferase [Spiribacter salinus]
MALSESAPRTIGILLCDDLHEELRTRWSSYLSLFETLVADEVDDLTAVGYRVHAGEWPENPGAADAWLVTGSRASVHEPPEWVAPLQAFVRQIHAAGQPLVGVCFGHQLVHSALGGRTERSARGWHLGSYPVECHAGFAGLPAGGPLRLLAVHQDQVVEPAPGFQRLASSPDCHWYASYHEQVFTIQGHPEFDREFFSALMQRVRQKAGDQAVDAALGALPPDDDTLAIRRFMRDWLRGRPALSDAR